MCSLHGNCIINCHCSSATLRSQNLRMTTDCFPNLSFLISPPLPPTPGHSKDQFIRIRSRHQFFTNPEEWPFPGRDRAEPKGWYTTARFVETQTPTICLKKRLPCPAFLLPNHTSPALWGSYKTGNLLNKFTSTFYYPRQFLPCTCSSWATCSSFCPTLPHSLLTTHQRPQYFMNMFWLRFSIQETCFTFEVLINYSPQISWPELWVIF